MHAISSVISYLIAMQQLGEDEVREYIGAEASGSQFNALELMADGRPHNPLNSAGSLMSTSLIFRDCSTAKKYERYEQIIEQMIGGKKAYFNNEMYLCEVENAHANYSLLYMMQEKKSLPTDAEVK